MAASTTTSSLESLPVELLTQISNHLHLYDLKRFRMVCTTTAEAVFEHMVTLMPKALTVHGKRSESLMDLACLGATFKMKDAITRLSIFYMKPEYSYLLTNVKLPGLVYLRLTQGRVESEEHIIALLESHKATLRELRIAYITIVASAESLVQRETQGWRKILQCLSSSRGFSIRHRVIHQVGYSTPDGTWEKWIVRRSDHGREYVPFGVSKTIAVEEAIEESLLDQQGRERLWELRPMWHGATMHL